MPESQTFFQGNVLRQDVQAVKLNWIPFGQMAEIDRSKTSRTITTKAMVATVTELSWISQKIRLAANQGGGKGWDGLDQHETGGF